MEKVLIAGATGYLGGHITKELCKKKYFVRAIARNPNKLHSKDIHPNELIKAELTEPNSIQQCCEGIDIVISTVGITRQKDGLTYMGVDYHANLNLLQQAITSGVRKFIYVSALNGQYLTHLKIFEAKELFVEKLKSSGLHYSVIRPNGFYSDMSEFYYMAQRGRVYLFGNGELRVNPISGEDLAEICVQSINHSEHELNIGGPECLTHNDIASQAFEVLGKQAKVTHFPDWIRIVILKLVRTFTASKFYGPIEFFLTVMAMDMIAPQNGKITLKAYYTSLKNLDTKPTKSKQPLNKN